MAASAVAQANGDLAAVERPPEPVMLAPIYEGGARKNRGISMPPNLRLAPELRLTTGYTASNSYLNPAYMICRGGGCRLDYETDHTGNLLFANLTRPLLARWEIGFGLGIYRLDRIPDWALPQRLASDSALRRFHEGVLGEDSLPAVSGARDDRLVFALTDFAGRSLELEPERNYLLPLRIDLTRYFALRRTSRVSMGLNAGVHLSQPLEGDPGSGSGATALARGLDAGLSLNFLRSRRFTPNLSSTFHVQLARFRSDAHVTSAASPVSWDDSNRSQYALTFGLRFDGTFGGRAPCSLALSQITQSAPYDKDNYWTIDPVVFEGGNNLRGALAGANDYGVFTYACDYRSRRWQIALVEDIGGLSQLIDDDGAGTSYDTDFAVSFSVSWNPGRRRAATD